jgi:hypothetical protein
MKVPVGEDTVKPKAITVAWLIKNYYRLKLAIGCPILGVEDVGDLSFGVIAVSYDGCPEATHCGFIDEVAIEGLGLEGGVGEDVAGGGLADLGEAEHCDGVVEEVEECDVSGFDCPEELLCLFLVVHRT